jgi:uncharacterized damage-inducible protein DinB
MTELNALKKLYNYHFDTTFRLIDQSHKLEDTQYREKADTGRGSIHDLLFHLLNADRGWRIGLETGSRPSLFNPDAYPALGALEKGFELEKTGWEMYLQGLKPETIGQEMEFRAGQARVLTVNRRKVLQHVILHGMQHHAEISQLLSAAGNSPGDIDYIFYK